MNVLIEPLIKEEIPAIVEIEQHTFLNPWTISQFEEYLGKDNKSILVAKVDGHLSGYIIFEHVMDEGHISNLAVREKFRGQGIGRELVEFVLEEARKIDLKWIQLEVRESNKKARSLYSKYDFKEVRKRKEYYNKPVEDAIVLRLDITK
ncbi:ribosomal protein S18-alanine N-acetyltransferase [Candidatus Margulisiibacteriota bacterium]